MAAITLKNIPEPLHRRQREETAIFVTAEEIDRMKNEGRP